MSLGITFWNMVDLLAYVTMAGLVYVFVWKALLDYLDLNKESIRRWDMHIEFDITVSVTQEFIDYQFMDYEEG